MSENPKRQHGACKPSIHFIPPAVILEEARVMALGGSKYGPFNWNDKPVDASTYYDAAFRHLAAWYTGQNDDPESGASHLAHARACLGILLDALMLGTLIDDRPTNRTTSAADFIAKHSADPTPL